MRQLADRLGRKMSAKLQTLGCNVGQVSTYTIDVESNFKKSIGEIA
jgi:hypothetical protein